MKKSSGIPKTRPMKTKIKKVFYDNEQKVLYNLSIEISRKGLVSS